jgi:hypothetical protein
MIEITVRGDTGKTEKWLKAMSNGDQYRAIDSGARAGVSALAAATPARTGVTSASWNCTIVHRADGPKITWNNTHVNRGFNVAAGIQYGHGTGTGGYVQGEDYINPAMAPIFKAIADAVWGVVTRG